MARSRDALQGLSRCGACLIVGRFGSPDQPDGGATSGRRTGRGTRPTRPVADCAAAGGRIGDTDDYPFMYQRQFDDPDGYHYSPFWMKPDADPTA